LISAAAPILKNTYDFAELWDIDTSAGSHSPKILVENFAIDPIPFSDNGGFKHEVQHEITV
jgi:hypothetical protein